VRCGPQHEPTLVEVRGGEEAKVTIRLRGIEEIVPAPAFAGECVTVRGAELPVREALSVRIGGREATVRATSASASEVVLPDALGTGEHKVLVESAGEVLATASLEVIGPEDVAVRPDAGRRPYWYPLGGHVYHSGRAADVARRPLAFDADPHWFPGFGRVLSKEEYERLPRPVREPPLRAGLAASPGLDAGSVVRRKALLVRSPVVRLRRVDERWEAVE